MLNSRNPAKPGTRGARAQLCHRTYRCVWTELFCVEVHGIYPVLARVGDLEQVAHGVGSGDVAGQETEDL